MDRQPLTDRLGDRLLAEYGGAAAAYSLRALNGNGDNVVRVRRASDNDEKDFTAEQIELGEMVNWVNSQTVPPLDIGVETSEGRIPVPEGGTSIGTPAAAYSLRNLSTTYTGNVVDVRRNSDGTEESFTAAEVSDGTLKAWVLAPVSSLIGNEFWLDGVDDYLDVGAPLLPATGDFDIEFTWYVANESNPATFLYALSQGTSASDFLGVALTTEGKIAVYHCNTSPVFSSTLVYLQKFVKIRLQKVSGNLTVYLDDVSQTTVAVTGSISQTNARWGDTTFLTGNRHAFGLIYGDDVTGTANGSPELFTGQGFDGTVSKWYDQSGNTNHAVQTTPANQPTIVEGGSLVTGGLSFGGDDDALVANSLASSFSGDAIPISAFSVSEVSAASSEVRPVWRFSNSSIGNPLKQWQYRSSGYGMVYRADDGTNINDLNAGSYSVDEEYLHTIIVNDSEVMNGYENGTLLSQIDSLDANIGTVTLNEFEILPSPDVTLRELIIYPTDQSDNRTAIEANIGETYGISGIPAYDNTVDGFVETWYDQSGNGNDATQSVAASQPKIVDAGVLVTGGLAFDGVDDRLSFASSVSLSSNNFFVTSVLKVLEGNGVGITPVGNAVGNRFLISFDYDANLAQMRADDGSFLTESFFADEPTGNILLTVQRVSNTVTLFHQSSNQSTFNAAGESFTLGNLGQGFPSTYSKHLLNEIIIYNSDQSANRTAIETNINNHYSIYA